MDIDDEGRVMRYYSCQFEERCDKTLFCQARTSKAV